MISRILRVKTALSLKKKTSEKLSSTDDGRKSAFIAADSEKKLLSIHTASFVQESIGLLYREQYISVHQFYPAASALSAPEAQQYSDSTRLPFDQMRRNRRCSLKLFCSQKVRGTSPFAVLVFFPVSSASSALRFFSLCLQASRLSEHFLNTISGEPKSRSCKRALNQFSCSW